MSVWQYLSLCVAAFLGWLYWRERSKRLQSTSDMNQALQTMSHRKDHDTATGLLTPEAFDTQLTEAVLRVDQGGGSLSVLVISLDSFSLINDGFGLDAGDQVIREAAARVLACAEERVQVCRLAAGDLATFFSGGEPISSRFAQKLKAELAQPFVLQGNQTHTSCSIGIAVYPEHGAKAKILGHAALAMRIIRGSGGADFCVYDPKMAVQAREEAVLVNELRQALDGGQFELYFQPKIDAQSLQVTAAEALLRWHHPTRGFVSPVVFIPLAEKYGLMAAIGNWVVEEACRTAAQWQDNGLRMRVAVNISGYQMRQDDLVENILAVLTKYGVQPSRFTCEITETVAMEDTQATKLTFEKLRNAGFHVSIDDFGTGYSSLASLRRLPAAELKIDRAFVMDLEESEEARSIAQSIVNMARALSLKVIAEGVETVGQRDILVRMGCDELQGFLFSMPIPASELQGMAMNRHAEDSADFRDSLFATDFSPGPD